MSGPIVVPYHHRNESFCPKCNSLHTKWWPSLREGLCEDCLFAWKMPAPRVSTIRPTRNGGIT